MSVAIAMVPLSAGARLSGSKFAAHFADWDDVMGPPEYEKQKGTLTFEHAGCIVAVGLMPAPIPGNDLEGPVATSWLWPEAKAEIEKQRGHLIVTVIDKSEALSAVELRKLLTQVTASVVATSDGVLCVYWPEAGQLIKPDLFVEMAKEILPDGLPLLLWIDFRVGPVDEESGLSYGFTDGLEELGLMELVTENATESPGELRDRFIGIADYLLTNGPVINDGDTVGEDANERIVVQYDTSPFGHEGKVMRLDYSSKPRKRGWFGRR